VSVKFISALLCLDAAVVIAVYVHISLQEMGFVQAAHPQLNYMYVYTLVQLYVKYF
jgi:hypothetical protein